MNTITQITTRRQAVIKYAEKKGVTAAARRYNVGRATIYRWKEHYDGTLQSLQDRSHRPNSHPNQHTEEEIKLIKDMRKRNKHTGLVVFWVKLKQKGYTRSITSLWRMLRKLELQPVKPPNPKYISKPYEKMQYPGQRVQIDVKYVPDSFDDFKKQLAVHSRKYNNFPMRPLNWKSPSDYIKAFLKSGQVF